MENKNNSRLAFKKILFKYSIFGFIGGIVAFFIIMALNIPLSFLDDSLRDNRFISGLLEFLEYGPLILLAITFLSFGGIIYSVLLPPRKKGFTETMEPMAAGLMLILLVGTILFILIVTLPLAILLIHSFLWNRNGINLAAAIAIILISSYAYLITARIIVKIVKRRELPSWLNKILESIQK